MGEELSINSILSDEEMDNLFTDYEETSTEDKQSEEADDKTKKEETTENVTIEDFDDDDSESVGSGKDNKDQESSSSDEDGTSPNSQFYSSIAKALGEDGVFPDLSSEEISEIIDAESLRAAIDKQIQSGLEEKQKRIDEALGVGVEPDVIKQYENTLNYIDSISEDSLTAEDEQGETLRKNLIFQDFINRGYSKERAEREVKKSLDAGTDIEDAKEALNGNRDFFKSQYDKLINNAKAEAKKHEEERNKQAESLKKSILEDSKVFGELDVDKATRKKIFDNIAKPVYKDPNSGEYLTAIQRYEMENRVDFLKNLGLVFTLTDGFKNLDGLVKGKVKKEVSKGLRNLEKTINSTSRNSDGSLNFVNGSSDENSFFKGYSLDL